MREGPHQPRNIGGIWLALAPHRNWYFEMALWSENIAGEGRWMVESLNWTWVSSHSFESPALTLDPSGAQELMDALWAGGVRPSHGQAPDIRHLADMREIARAALRKAGIEANLPGGQKP